MGDWTVLTAWNDGDRFHDWHGQGKASPSQIWAGKPWTAAQIVENYCNPVVKEHQDMTEHRGPTFMITTRYISVNADRVKQGWKYIIEYPHPSNDQIKMEPAYGFLTREGAKAAAEERCRAIAKALLPIETYTYRPEF